MKISPLHGSFLLLLAVKDFLDCMDSGTVSERPRSIRELSNLFTELSPVQADLADALKDWETPQLIVVGAEGSGNSSLLERLSLLPIFPRSEGKSTRLPLRLELRDAPVSAPLTLQVRNLQRERGSGALESTQQSICSGSEATTCLMQVCLWLPSPAFADRVGGG